MEHDFQHSYREASVSEKKMRMLRGYDPLREIYQWNLLSLLLVCELVVVGFASLPVYNSAFLLVGVVGSIRPGTLIPFLLPLGILPFLFIYKFYHGEREARAKLRSQPLMLHKTDQVSTGVQSSPALRALALPMRIESQRKRFSTIRIVSEAVLLTMSLVASCTIMLAHPSEPLFLYSAVPSLLAVMIIALSVGIWIEMRLWFAERYLFPSLNIDDEAITARYGRATISIAWRDVCYFGVVNSVVFRQLSTPNTSPTLRQLLKSRQLLISSLISPHFPAPAYEAFELSDGENVICWLKTSSLRSRRLLRCGEVALSDQEYAAFTRQLAAFILEKTGLPFYDLRLVNAYQH